MLKANKSPIIIFSYYIRTKTAHYAPEPSFLLLYVISSILLLLLSSLHLFLPEKPQKKENHQSFMLCINLNRHKAR